MFLVYNKVVVCLFIFIISTLFGISCFDTPVSKVERDDIKGIHSGKVEIFFKLGKGEKSILNYISSTFEGKQIVFSNPGNTDTVINRNVNTEMPLIFTYGKIDYSKKNTDNELVLYTILAKPGDTIKLSYSNNFFLKNDNISKKIFITDSSTSFYTKSYSDKTRNQLNNYKKKDWEIFYSTSYKNIFDAFQAEKIRINKEFENKKIDSTIYFASVLNSTIHYYKTLFNLIGPSMEYPELLLPYTLNSNNEIESILKNEHIFLSNELIAVVFGMIQTKIIREGGDFLDFANIYNEIAHFDLGKFKPAFLSRCIYLCSSNKNKEFEKILKDFKVQYSNTVYSEYIDSLLNPEKDNINTADNLITLKNEMLTWNSLYKNNPSHFIVIDFWASWCGPCRQQFPIIDSIKRVLTNYPISFISINVDENIDDWKIASESEKKYLNENNFHLVNPKTSAIAKKIKLSSIPRVLVLKDSKIISSDFYSPSEPNFTKELIKLLKK